MHATEVAQVLRCIARLLFGKGRVETARKPNLLGIDRGIAGGDTRDHLFMKQGGDAVGRILAEPLLRLGHLVAEFLEGYRRLAGKLREVADAVGH